jgi:transcription elongation factor Elf1
MSEKDQKKTVILVDCRSCGHCWLQPMDFDDPDDTLIVECPYCGASYEVK